jgi:hypothetical protein
VIVTSPEPHALLEARVLRSALAAERIPVGSLIVNRVATDPMPDAALRAWAGGGKPTAKALVRALPGLAPADRNRAEAMIENYLLYRRLAARSSGDRRAGDLGLAPGAARGAGLEDEVVRLEKVRRFLRCLGQHAPEQGADRR